MFENKDQDLTPVGRLGEFKLIRHLTKDFEPKSPDVLKGIGDDAAVIAMENDKVQVVSTDLLIEGVHFDLTYAPLQHLGYKAVAANVSDIYAMNAEPYGITVSIALSSRFTVEAMEAFYFGVKSACEKFNVDLLGGDTSSSRTGLMISVTALGKADKNQVVYRSGAKPNDLLCLSGDLGAAYAGLQVLEREKAVFVKNPEMQPELGLFDYVVGRQLKPEARKDIFDELKKRGVKPTSMIDISDGLASEMFHLSEESNIGVNVYADKIMLDPQTVSVAEDFDLHPMTMAMNGGEDYELLFTVGLEDFQQVEEMADVKVIGHIVEKHEGVNLITQGGTVIPLQAQGWTHFSTK